MTNLTEFERVLKLMAVIEKLQAQNKRYRDCLLDLKRHSNHGIDEELWRIDEALKDE